MDQRAGHGAPWYLWLAILCCALGALGAPERASAQAAAPANDAFAGALTLTAANSPATGSTTYATAELGEPSHAPGRSASNSVWFRFDATSTRDVSLGTCGTEFSSILAVYTGTTLSGLQQAAAATSPCANPLTFVATEGTTYWIALSSAYYYDYGSYTLRLDPGPYNDSRATAKYLNDSGTLTSNNALATSDAGEPEHAGRPARHSVWYLLYGTPGARQIFETCSTTAFDTVLAAYVYDDDSSAIEPVVSADDTPGCGRGQWLRPDLHAG